VTIGVWVATGVDVGGTGVEVCVTVAVGGMGAVVGVGGAAGRSEVHATETKMTTMPNAVNRFFRQRISCLLST
jgi:hypothetical protein